MTTDHTSDEYILVEATPEEIISFTKAVITICADAPGIAGRLRMARILTGGKIASDHDVFIRINPSIRTDHDISNADAVRIIDSLILNRWIAQTPGVRPALVLTRGGFEELQLMEEQGEAYGHPVRVDTH